MSAKGSRAGDRLCKILLISAPPGSAIGNGISQDKMEADVGSAKEQCVCEEFSFSHAARRWKKRRPEQFSSGVAEKRKRDCKRAKEKDCLWRRVDAAKCYRPSQATSGEDTVASLPAARAEEGTEVGDQPKRT
jgi:hypothetical protein